MFDSERNKQHQRVFCNEICRIPNETVKQLAVRIETQVRKAYSPNTHDYKNRKMTEIVMIVDKLEKAKITMKLEETEKLKKQPVNNIQITTSQIKHTHDSDTELAEKITQILNIYEKNTNFKGKQSFKK